MADLFADRAHARNTDPGTSHEAAAAATAGMERQRRMVLAYAKSRGEPGFMDAQLEEAYPDESDSGLRTRRSELTARNVILDSGRRDRYGDSVRKRIVWVHRDFVEGAPPEKDAPEVPAVTDALKTEALAFAKQLRESAAYLKKTYGLSLLSAHMERSAELLDLLAR